MLFTPRPAGAIGAYEDLARFSAFLRAPLQSSLDGRVTRADAESEDAAIFYVGSHLPVRTRYLIQLEISYASIVRGGEIDNGFGDFRIRGKTTVWGGNTWAIPVYAGLRAGSGSNEVFPYGTKSVDWELGIALVDTVGSVSWWADVGGVLVTQLPDHLEGTDLHETFVQAVGGLAIGFKQRYSWQVGAGGMLYKSGARRGIVFTELDLRYNPSFDFLGFIQAETGPDNDRVNDLAGGVGFVVFY
jgi:hypothetical protein